MSAEESRIMSKCFTAAVIALALAVTSPSAQTQSAAGAKAAVHAKQAKRLLIKDAMVIPGPAVPALFRLGASSMSKGSPRTAPAAP